VTSQEPAVSEQRRLAETWWVQAKRDGTTWLYRDNEGRRGYIEFDDQGHPGAAEGMHYVTVLLALRLYDKPPDRWTYTVLPDFPYSTMDPPPPERPSKPWPVMKPHVRPWKNLGERAEWMRAREREEQAERERQEQESRE